VLKKRPFLRFDQLLRGTVHDTTARRMGGVVGHAGVFSTAHDVNVFVQALLEACAAAEYVPADASERGRPSSGRKETEDPGSDIYVVLLTNSIHTAREFTDLEAAGRPSRDPRICTIPLSAQVVEHLIAGVVAGDEGDAGSAVAAGATEVETVDAHR